MHIWELIIIHIDYRVFRHDVCDVITQGGGMVFTVLEILV